MSLNIRKVCRTCLSTSGPLVSIFKESSVDCAVVRIADMLKCLTSIHFEPDIEMPEKICLLCVSEINRCYAFKIKCELSNNTLTQMLNDASEEEGSEEDFYVKKVGLCEGNEYEKELKEEVVSHQYEECEEDPEEFQQENEELDNDNENDELSEDARTNHDPLEKEIDGPIEITTRISRDIENIELIKEIKKYPCIYNSKHPDYRHSIRKAKAWSKISKAVHRPENLCQTRWKNMRDHYVKRTKLGNKITSRWPLMKYLQFISHCKQKESASEYNSPEACTKDSAMPNYHNIQLIQEIEKYKCIYDYSSVESREKRILRLRAWHDISMTMNVPVQQLQQRWKTIRDRYVKLIRSASEDGTTEIHSHWELVEYLQFLNDQIGRERPAKKQIDIPPGCEPIEVDVTEITYGTDFDDSQNYINFKPDTN